MKKVILIFLLTSLLFSSSIKDLVNSLYELDYYQKSILQKTFEKAKHFNLQYTLTAIVWQESEFGKYQINLSDPSCGAFHIIPIFYTKNRWKQSRLCERLIKDYDFSFSLALEKIKYFYNYWRNRGYSKNVSWKMSIMSYNAGFSYRNGIKYYKEIIKKIKALKIYFNKKGE